MKLHDWSVFTYALFILLKLSELYITQKIYKIYNFFPILKFKRAAPIPSKVHADNIIDVATLNVTQVADELLSLELVGKSGFKICLVLIILYRFSVKKFREYD